MNLYLFRVAGAITFEMQKAAAEAAAAEAAAAEALLERFVLNKL